MLEKVSMLLAYEEQLFLSFSKAVFCYNSVLCGDNQPIIVHVWNTQPVDKGGIRRVILRSYWWCISANAFFHLFWLLLYQKGITIV